MKRATPVHIRQALELVEQLKHAGIRFVPIPVYNNKDNNTMISVMAKRVDVFEGMVNQHNLGGNND